MRKIHFEGYIWPFEKDVIADVCAILSPAIKNGVRILPVYFKASSQSLIFKIDCAINAMPSLSIGSRFQNGYPVEPREETAWESMLSNHITDMNIMLVSEAIRETQLFNTYHLVEKMLEDYCVSFLYSGNRFLILCYDVVKAFYIHNSLCANQLLTSDGLNAMVQKATSTDDCLDIDFSGICEGHLSKRFTEYIVWILCTPELRNGWESVYCKYVEKRKLVAIIPHIPNLLINYQGITYGNTTFITALQIPEIALPFSKIYYGSKRRLVLTEH